VITSSVCPALEYVRDAVVEVPVNDVKAYGDAIVQLCEDPAFYQEKVRGCTATQQQFYDADRGWGAAVKRMLRLIDPSDRPCAESAAGRPAPAE
jgi:glycogen synthase